ncbi:MAG TPA: bifunctional phosphopantothenoylcysteine decarboxylase/phosphopantothenate--cysteine ligase CoaBC [Burkholderiales bacterium]|nr:bifunctional phosphopantothenoylcysteine decarboxylase/phosphopantothenate--cysteine ligase CoaBC [Burkholderiales bacterium]
MSATPAKRVLLGITGGVAAYKAAALTRLLVRAGMDVRVVMTEAATRFITPMTLQALSGQKVWTDLWDPAVPDHMAHIELSRDRELIVVAPATADFIAKAALGLADDLLSSLVLARECPLLVAPAMNRQMWEQPATQRNVRALRGDGVLVVGPAVGDQACGETGPGRMVEPEALLEEIEAAFQPKLLAGKRVLVSAGPTEEPIDPVRVLTNLSSGRMGYAIAQAAREAGAQVTLVSGPVQLPTPVGVARVNVRTAREMFEAVKSVVDACDIFFSVAAVADYRVKKPAAQKIKKGSAALRRIELEENPDILAWVAARPRPPFCVGFAAESENLAAHAKAKREKKGIPLIAANLAQEALGAADSALTLYDARGAHPLGRAAKPVLARKLVLHVAGMLASAGRRRRSRAARPAKRRKARAR